MVIYVLSLATIAQYFASPSSRRADGSDMLNSIEVFSLLVGILMLVAGLGKTSTTILLEPLINISDPNPSIAGEGIFLNDCFKEGSFISLHPHCLFLFHSSQNRRLQHEAHVLDCLVSILTGYCCLHVHLRAPILFIPCIQGDKKSNRYC